MQFLLKSSKMDSIFESDLQLNSKTKKNSYFFANCGGPSTSDGKILLLDRYPPMKIFVEVS